MDKTHTFGLDTPWTQISFVSKSWTPVLCVGPFLYMIAESLLLALALLLFGTEASSFFLLLSGNVEDRQDDGGAQRGAGALSQGGGPERQADPPHNVVRVHRTSPVRGEWLL